MPSGTHVNTVEISKFKYFTNVQLLRELLGWKREFASDTGMFVALFLCCGVRQIRLSSWERGRKGQLT